MTPRILMAHRITDEPPRDWGVSSAAAISVDDFFERLDRLVHAPGVPLEEMLPHTHGVCLTLDDGYAENWDELLPELEARELPCTIFVTSGYIDGSVKPFEWELEALVDRLVPEDAKPGIYEEWRRPLRKASAAKRDRWVSSICARHNIERSSLDLPRFLDENELRELAKHPLISIGAHTHEHTWLPSLGLLALWQELAPVRRRLADIAGHAPVAISYPYGGDSALVRLAAGLAGYQIGVGTVPPDGAPWRDMRWPRVDLNRPT